MKSRDQRPMPPQPMSLCCLLALHSLLSNRSYSYFAYALVILFTGPLIQHPAASSIRRNNGVSMETGKNKSKEEDGKSAVPKK
ncbi:hypothetical protein C0Q70_10248 [Pomacea canaliculata]|uniref:Uncharacterized protein n=1 Tax=Pomacea canaliculata TaxID=400727 RepID=A0A2T7PC34_POMCA|nr:hypothetical protein C0Q70_10248 [Pomacea canaliculata]